MSIKMMMMEGRTRPSFACDKCGRPIQPEKGLLIWSHSDKLPTHLVCCDCDSGEQLYSQELDAGLIYLLLWARWLDDDLKSTAKLLAAAKKAMALSSL